MKINPNDLETIADLHLRGDLTTDQANVQTIRNRRVMLVVTKVPASVRADRNDHPIGVCDKCLQRIRQPVVTVMPCPDCGRVYRRCAVHDGMDGCKRSLSAHKPLCFGRRKP